MNKKLNMIIFSESLLNFEHLKLRLNEFYSNQLIISYADDIVLAMKLVKENHFDVIVADIDINTRNAFNLISTLKSFPGEIVFQSASTDFAISAYDLSAADYLLKPFSDDRLKQAMERVFGNVKENQEKTIKLKTRQSKKIKKLNSIMVKDQNSNIMIKMTDIIYLYAVKGMIYIKTVNKTYQQFNTLTALEKLLDPACFLRTSRSYICNLNHVKSIITLKHNRYALILNHDSSELNIPIKRGIKLKIVERIKKSQTYIESNAS